MGNNAQIDLPWSDMPILLALVRHKSLSAAARNLKVDRTTVARRLDRLEAQLGVQLFERLSGNLVPTDQGRRVLSIAERAEQELSSLEASDKQAGFKFGKVRIAVSEHVFAAFASYLNCMIHEQRDILFEFTTSNRFADLSKYEADIVLRIGRIPADNMRTIDLGGVHFALYRQKKETGSLRVFWPRAADAEIPMSVRKQHPEAQIVAAIDGVLPTREMIVEAGGAGILPRFLGDRDDRLIACADDIPVGNYHLFIGCLSEQRNLNRIRIAMRQLERVLRQALSELPT